MSFVKPRSLMGMEAPHPALVITLQGDLDRSAVPALCDHIELCLRGSEGVVVCDVGALSAADMAAVGALARLRLAAKRRGHGFRLRNASADLRRLLVLTGLYEALPVGGISGVETIGQTEEWEQPFGIQEEHYVLDPPAGSVEDL
jgi:anti-anti-sigma factor